MLASSMSKVEKATLYLTWLNRPNERVRRGDRVAEGARLESVCAAMYRGFESPPLRHFFIFGKEMVVVS